MDSKDEKQQCRYCNCHSKLVCKRCGDFYCSEKCQHLDWSNHRYICFPKPPLSDIKLELGNENLNMPCIIDNTCILQDMEKMLKSALESLERVENNRKRISNNVELSDYIAGGMLNDRIEKSKAKNDQKQSKAPYIEEQSEIGNPEPPFKTVAFEIDSHDIDAVIIETSLVGNGYLVCVKKEHICHLSETQQFLNKYNFSHAFHTPKIGEYCVAKFENDWYRAKVLEVMDGGTKYKVFYTDFMNTFVVTSNEIRRYPNGLQINCYSNLCLIYDFPKNLSPAQSDFLNSGIYDIRINRIMSKKNNAFVVECQEIIEILNNLQT